MKEKRKYEADGVVQWQDYIKLKLISNLLDVTYIAYELHHRDF